MAPAASLLPCYGQLEKILRKIARGLKLLFTLEFLLRLAAVCMLLLLGNLWVSRFAERLPYLPFGYSLLSLAMLAWVLFQGLRRAVRGLSLLRVARGLEDKYPLLRDDVTNSLLLFDQIENRRSPARISLPLVHAHLARTVAALAPIRPREALDFNRLRQQLKLAVPVALAFAAVLVLDAGFFKRSTAAVFKPLSVLPARETLLTLENAPAVVLRGTALTIRATAHGYIPERLVLKVRPASGAEIDSEMQPEGGGRFSYRLPPALQSFHYRAYAGRAASADHYVRVEAAPDIRALQLALVPPAYTGLAPQIVVDGNIEVLKGTTAKVQVETTKPVHEGLLTLNGKHQLPLEKKGDRLQGSLLVLYPGTYTVSLQDEFGFVNADPARYRIALLADKYPEAEILQPADELQVSGREVLPLLYSAHDDFGLSAVRLIYQRGGVEHAVPLAKPDAKGPDAPVRFDWDLAALALTPGERIAYRLEVWDNDAVSGPKVGYSRTQTLYLRDEKAQAARETERAGRIWEALLALLADHLEEIRDGRGVAEALAAIAVEVDRQLERMGPEQLERFDLESLKRNMAALSRAADKLPREKITQELERLTLLAEDILKKARMEEVEALAREIKNRQTRLVDALRDQQGPLTPETLKGLLQELEKLQELTAQVMEALSRMAVQLPDDFINSKELQSLDFQDFFKDLNAIRQQLAAGDLKGALEAAQRLLQNLSEMMAAMARAGAQSTMGAFGRLQSEMSHQTSELEEIVKAQQEILTATEDIAGELREALEAETGERLEQAADALQRALARLEELLPSEQGDAVAEMKTLLDQEELERLAALSERLAAELPENPAAQKTAADLAHLVRGLTPPAGAAVSAEMAAEFPGLTGRQQALSERTGKLGAALENLSQLFPGMDTAIIDDIKNAAGHMDRAAGRLQQSDAPGAVPPEEEAIRALTRSQQAMQQMASQMSRQMAMQMQAGRWGYPMGYDPYGGWYYGPWGSLPTLPQPEVKQRREKGYTGIDKEEFNPPGKDAYRAPPVLRERVMEALKENIPPQYRREVQRYFKGLSE